MLNKIQEKLNDENETRAKKHVKLNVKRECCKKLVSYYRNVMPTNSN